MVHLRQHVTPIQVQGQDSSSDNGDNKLRKLSPANGAPWQILSKQPWYYSNRPDVSSDPDYNRLHDTHWEWNGAFLKGQFLSPGVLQWEMSYKAATGVVNAAASPALMYFKVLRDSCLWSLTKITVAAVKEDKKPMTRGGKGENTHGNHKRLLHTSIKNHFNTIAAWMTNKWLSSLYDAAFQASGYWY